MAKAITREMAELAMRAKAAAEAGDKEQALEATNALEIAFAGVVSRAPSDERMAILGMCYATYELLGEWEMAALKIEDAICYAEKHHRNSPETAADYGHLAEAYIHLGDCQAAVIAFEIAIEQIRQTPQRETFGAHYERRLREVGQRLSDSMQDSTSVASPTRRNPRLLRCMSDRGSGKRPETDSQIGTLNEKGFPQKFPDVDPIYLVVWPLEKLPTAQEANSIAWGFVNSGDLPAPTERTRLARMSYTQDWTNPNALSFNIAVHKLLKNSFPELAPYIIVSDTGFERDDRVKFSVVTGSGQMSGNQSAQMQFRVVEVRPGSSA